MKMVPEVNVRTVREEKYSLSLTAQDIRDAFELPDAAEIEVHVPSGGDWSNEFLSLDQYRTYVSWSKTVDSDAANTD